MALIAVITQVIERDRAVANEVLRSRAEFTERRQQRFVDDAAKAEVRAIAEQSVFAVAGQAGRRPEQHPIADVHGVGELWQDCVVIELDHALVRVDVEDPRTARGIDRRVASGGEIVCPLVIDESSAQVAGDLAGTIGRSGIDNDDPSARPASERRQPLEKASSLRTISDAESSGSAN